MEAVLFFLAAIITLAGAVGTVTLTNAFYSVLALVTHLIGLAVLFLLLRAQFIAAAQIVVYAGAIMVLYVFVVSYVGGIGAPQLQSEGAGVPLTGLGLVFGIALFVELTIAVVGSGLTALNTEGVTLTAGYGTPAQIGQLLLTRFLLPFEAASFLLLVTAVGAVTLARRRGGVSDAEEARRVSVAQALRPLGSGTMAEAVGDTAQSLRTTQAERRRGEIPAPGHHHDAELESHDDTEAATTDDLGRPVGTRGGAS
jgi:NADH-quinone oxidoreductase subunit J